MSIMLLNKEMDVLKEFSEDYHKKVYGRNLAKKLKMNQKTASNVLNKLEKDLILKSESEGRNKYYSLNKSLPSIKEILKIIEISRKQEFLERNKKIADLFRKIEEKTEGLLVVFGSYANYTQNQKSDLDLFVKGNIKNLDELEELYKIKLNVIKSSKFDKNNNLIKEVIKNHILLKGVEEFVDLTW